jgi:HNH endonuclease
MSFYGIDSKNICMMLGPCLGPGETIINAHLWPNHTRGRGLQFLGLPPEDLDSARNYLRLHKSIEKAFDERRIIFELHDVQESSFHLRIKVLDPSLEKWSIDDIRSGLNPGESFRLRLNPPDSASEAASDGAPSVAELCLIDGLISAHRFVGEKKPFTRVLAQHIIASSKFAAFKTWIEPMDVSPNLDSAYALARWSLNDKEMEIFKQWGKST